MKTIKIDFKYFWKGFNLQEFKKRFSFLSPFYDFRISNNPDFVFFSQFCGDNRVMPKIATKAVRVFISGGEPIDNFSMDLCDYAFTYQYVEHNRHIRLPFYVHMLLSLGYTPDDLVKKGSIEKKPYFCNFVFSRDVLYRNDFFHELCKYKKVDSGGKCFNNVGKRIPTGWIQKLKFIKDYKFTIAYDNEQNINLCGLTGEKIVHPMLVNSIPIFFGNPEIKNDFNPESFLDRRDFSNDLELIERIIEIDKNDYLYRKILSIPWYHNNQIPEHANITKLTDIFRSIFG